MLATLEQALLTQISAEKTEVALGRYRHWYQFLHHNVNFTIHSHWHGLNHCSRVLLYAVVLGYRLNLNESELDTLCKAAVFHDTRRFDDGFDVGHGDRAAIYYRQYSQSNQLDVDEIAATLMAFHDRDDKLGFDYISQHFAEKSPAEKLYKIFKDADGLDRFRLGEQDFNPRYLRNEESKNLVDFARKLVARTE